MLCLICCLLDLRTGQSNGSDDFIVRPDSMSFAYGGVDDEIEPPSQVHHAASPVGTMPMVPPSASPDEMMRAYAHARTTGASPAGSQQGMRTLYAPANNSGLTPSAAYGADEKDPHRKSVNSEVSQYSDADVGKAT
jgi:hypothetical protein